MCDLCSPSESDARREPTNTKTAIFGKTTNVARKNCHSASDCMDCTRKCAQGRAKEGGCVLLTANSVFEYTHGGNGEARMSMIRGRPFVA